MPIQKQSYQITGMRQDNLVATGFSSKFAHEIMNMRLNTIGDFTTASWTTEKGTLQTPITWISNQNSVALYNALYPEGETGRIESLKTIDIYPIGQAVINDNWVVFCTITYNDATIKSRVIKSCDSVIFKLRPKLTGSNLTLIGEVLYAGNLGFNNKYPIETIPYFENEKIQKVYWTDGLNQPRVINIAGIKDTSVQSGVIYPSIIPDNADTQFDFAQEVSLSENIFITKKATGAGVFPPGTVKYLFTYYRKNGQETNIIYDSPLYYATAGDRGCSPDEISGDTFEIKIFNFDTEHKFDYIRIYSVIRTSEGGTHIVRKVTDLPIPKLMSQSDTLYASLPRENNNLSPFYGQKYLTFTDANSDGEILDPNVIFYLGSKDATVQTICNKENVLFLGNIHLNVQSLKEVSKTWSSSPRVSFNSTKSIKINDLDLSKVYYNTFQLNKNSSDIKIYKTFETYKFGLQAQDKYGNWSDILPLAAPGNPLNYNVVNNNLPIITESLASGSTVTVSIPSVSLNTQQVNKLIEKNYRRVRLMCCFPNKTKQSQIAQGILCKTIWDKNLSNNNSNQAPQIIRSSWLFRVGAESGADFTYKEIMNGGFWVNQQPLSNKYSLTDELVTFHSPDIEFDEAWRTFSHAGFKVRKLGMLNLANEAYATYIDSTLPSETPKGERGDGYKENNKPSIRISPFSNSTINELWPNGGASNSIQPLPSAYFRDWNVYASLWSTTNVAHTEEAQYSYPIFLWHRNGSLNNYVKDVASRKVRYANNDYDEWTVRQTAKLNTKVYSDLLFSDRIIYDNTLESEKTIDYFDIFDSNSDTALNIANKIYCGNNNFIVGNYDRVVSWRNGSDYTEEGNSWADLEVRYENSANDHGVFTVISGYYDIMGKEHDNSTPKHTPCSDPIQIKYKSTPHGIFRNRDKNNNSLIDMYWDYVSTYYTMPVVNISRDIPEQFTFQYETIKDATDIYIPCGEAVLLHTLQQGETITLTGPEGDAYYQRYDCLKTYPYATNDTNQVVEILSFMCETRINLDGRYDRNRGLTDNTTVTNTNFNLINKSYTQSNNLFAYTELDELGATIDTFENQLAWSKEKVSGEDIDTWTNLTLANTADADGICGPITKITSLKDSLILFQNRGVSKIGYDEKTAISTESGTPLEIATSGKYTGLTYFTKDIGCQNKWSISNTKNGVYFIDDSRQELIRLDESLTPISTQNGFDAFFIKQLPSYNKIANSKEQKYIKWTPLNPENFVSYYDKVSNDIYFINANYCLAWNETSGTFTSFYNYENIPLMVNLGNYTFMWRNNLNILFEKGPHIIGKGYDEEIITYTTREVNIEHNIIKPTTTTVETESTVIVDSDTCDSIVWITQDNADIPAEQSRILPIGETYEFNSSTNVNDSFLKIMVRPYGDFHEGDAYNLNVFITLSYKTSETESKQINCWIKADYTLTNDMWILEEDSYSAQVATSYERTGVDIVDNLKIGLESGKLNYKYPCINIGSFTLSTEAGQTAVQNNVITADSLNPAWNTDIKYEDMCTVTVYDINTDSEDYSIGSFQIINGDFNKNNIWLTSWQSDKEIFICPWEDLGNNSLILTRTDIITETVTTFSDTLSTVRETVIEYIPTAGTTHIDVYESTPITMPSSAYAARRNSNYSYFFGEMKPYWMTLVCDGLTNEGNAFPADKVFNNIEYRADCFNEDGVGSVINEPVFTKKAAWNGYQKYWEFPIDAERKFNTWRVQLPRATYEITEVEGVPIRTLTRDRIRNPFCYIKLLNDDVEKVTSNRMIIHDLAVYFDMR